MLCILHEHMRIGRFCELCLQEVQCHAEPLAHHSEEYREERALLPENCFRCGKTSSGKVTCPSGQLLLELLQELLAAFWPGFKDRNLETGHWKLRTMKRKRGLGCTVDVAQH